MSQFSIPLAGSRDRRATPGRRRAGGGRDCGLNLLATIWVIVGTVAAIDMYLAVKFSDVLLSEELNPIGRWLIRCDGGSVALFMALKLVGTVSVLGIVTQLYRCRHTYWKSVGVSIAICQLALLGVLFS